MNTATALRCFAAGCALLFTWGITPRGTWRKLARRLSGALAAFWRYLTTSQKNSPCPDCARDRARAARDHPSRKAARTRLTELSDEETDARFRALTGIPEQRDGGRQ